MLADGVIFADGLMLADRIMLADGVWANAALLGDGTTCLKPAQ